MVWQRRRNYTSIRTVTELPLLRECLALGYERASCSNLPALRPADEAGADYSGRPRLGTAVGFLLPTLRSRGHATVSVGRLHHRAG